MTPAIVRPESFEMPSADRFVRAAGGLITRTGRDGRRELLLVHRPRYDDWTLPKGKAKPRESYRACAAREAEEETGLVCDVGEEIAVSEYTDGAGRPKRVRYYAMTPLAGAEAAAQNEVDAVRWLTRERAIDQLSYERDVDVVERLPSLGG